MNYTSNNILLIIIILFFSSNISLAQNRLEIKISNVTENSGDIFVAIFNSKESFLKKSLKSTSTKSLGKEVTVYFNDLPDGNYGVSIYQDTNKNEKLDKGMFGPTEPYGFSNNAEGIFGPPNYDDCKFRLDNKNSNINIRLK